MKIPSHAIAMRMRKEDKELDNKFMKLPDAKCWEWLAYACKNEPLNSLNFARRLVEENETQAPSS